jgi:holo-[acyl-carrier protein] synthase
MILGLGTDLTTVSRIAELYRETGARFLERVLSPEEQQVAATKSGESLTRWLARRFAAKEAVAKALGTGIGAAAFFTEISIVNDEAGKPLVKLSGRAAQRLDMISPIPRGKRPTIHLSISDERDLAMAFAIIEA